MMSDLLRVRGNHVVVGASYAHRCLSKRAAASKAALTVVPTVLVRIAWFTPPAPPAQSMVVIGRCMMR